MSAAVGSSVYTTVQLLDDLERHCAKARGVSKTNGVDVVDTLTNLIGLCKAQQKKIDDLQLKIQVLERRVDGRHL